MRLGNGNLAVSIVWCAQTNRFTADESLHGKGLYVQENPVRAGLVKNSKDWPYQIGLDEPIEF